MTKKEDKLLVWDYFCALDNELRKNRENLSKVAIRFNLQEKLNKNGLIRTEKLKVFCKKCEKEIKIDLTKGLYSDMCLSNWICQDCYSEFKESKKSLQIHRMEV